MTYFASRSYPNRAAAERATHDLWPADAKFLFGDRVTKTSGSSWTGTVCGFYRSSLTATKALEQEVHPQVVHGQLTEAFIAIANVLNDIEKELFR